MWKVVESRGLERKEVAARDHQADAEHEAEKFREYCAHIPIQSRPEYRVVYHHPNYIDHPEPQRPYIGVGTRPEDTK